MEAPPGSKACKPGSSSRAQGNRPRQQAPPPRLAFNSRADTQEKPALLSRRCSRSPHRGGSLKSAGPRTESPWRKVPSGGPHGEHRLRGPRNVAGAPGQALGLEPHSHSRQSPSAVSRGGSSRGPILRRRKPTNRAPPAWTTASTPQSKP